MSSLTTDDTFGLSEDYYKEMSHWYQAGYSLGVIGSLAVLLTGILFWNDMVRNKIYMKLLMAMSLCDALASVMGIFGFGDIPNAVCAAQGAMWYFFNRASWMFTVCITVTLFTQVTYDRVRSHNCSPFPFPFPFPFAFAFTFICTCSCSCPCTLFLFCFMCLFL